MSLLELFVEVDDFHKTFESWAARQQLPGKAKRGPAPSLSPSEIMTFVIHFHQVGYRDFKSFYQKHVCKHLAAEFPKLVSYGRFTELMPGVLLLLCAYLRSRFGRCTIGEIYKGMQLDSSPYSFRDPGWRGLGLPDPRRGL